MADIEITPLPVIRPFLALVDGKQEKDALVLTDREYRDMSAADFDAAAVAKTEERLAARDDLAAQQAVRDIEELIQQIESMVDVSTGDPDVDLAFAAPETGPLLTELLNRKDIAQHMIEGRVNGLYGPVWVRWLSMVG